MKTFSIFGLHEVSSWRWVLLGLLLFLMPAAVGAESALPEVRKAKELIAKGKLEKAQTVLEKGLNRYEATNADVGVSQIYEALAEIALARKDKIKAIEYYRKVWHLSRLPIVKERVTKRFLVLEQEVYDEYVATHGDRWETYMGFLRDFPHSTLIMAAEKRRDELSLENGRARARDNPQEAERWFLEAALSPTPEIARAAEEGFLTINPDLPQFLGDTLNETDLTTRIGRLEGYSLPPELSEKKKRLIEAIIFKYLESTYFERDVVRSPSGESIHSYLSKYGASSARDLKHVFAQYARVVDDPVSYEAYLRAFYPAQGGRSAKLHLEASIGFCCGRNFWFEVWLDGKKVGTLEAPYRRKGERGEVFELPIPEGNHQVVLRLWEKNYPLFSGPETIRHNEGDLKIEDEFSSLYTYWGVMDRNSGVSLCVKKVPLFAPPKKEAEMLLTDLEKYRQGFVRSASASYCPGRSVPGSLTLGDIAEIAKAMALPVLQPAANALVSSYRELASRNLAVFDNVGTLDLNTGSLCGEGGLSIKDRETGQITEVDCCGWGNLGHLARSLSAGSYELNFQIKTCTGKILEGKGVAFSIAGRKTTTVDLNLDSGGYSVRNW